MKQLTQKIALVITTILISALPTLAAEGMDGSTMNQGQQGMKDECLLVAKNCGDHIDTIQQRINRINREIGKGSAVYTPGELMRLNSQLEDAERTLDLLLTNSGA